MCKYLLGETLNLKTMKQTALTSILDTADTLFRRYQSQYDEVVYMRDDKKFTSDSLGILFYTLRKVVGYGAKSLVSSDNFISSVYDNKDILQSFAKLKLETLKDTDTILRNVGKIFAQMEIVTNNSKLVTVSNVLHFMYPNLFVPISRRYSIRFFHTTVQPTLEGQVNTFCRIFLWSHRYAQAYRSELKDISREYNLHVPKVIDHLIIGFTKNNS